MSADEKRIREFAYQIWESEGLPRRPGRTPLGHGPATGRSGSRRGGTEEDPRSGQGRQGNPGPAASAGRQAAQAEGRVPGAARQRKPAAAKPRSRRKPEAGE